jgi:hypothetical protein
MELPWTAQGEQQGSGDCEQEDRSQTIANRNALEPEVRVANAGTSKATPATRITAGMAK